ncbi:hypothetical protein ABK040_011500 [Willaertia magna]
MLRRVLVQPVKLVNKSGFVNYKFTIPLMLRKINNQQQIASFSNSLIYNSSSSTSNDGVHPDFQTKLSTNQEQIREQKLKEIDEIVKNNKIVLFMKGTPDRPECGFSNAVVTVLKKMYDVEFASYNMNKDVAMKEALKEYTDWPTIPQLYVNGEFIGGCDIVLNLHRENQLEDILYGEKKEEDK